LEMPKSQSLAMIVLMHTAPTRASEWPDADDGGVAGHKARRAVATSNRATFTPPPPSHCKDRGRGPHRGWPGSTCSIMLSGFTSRCNSGPRERSPKPLWQNSKASATSRSTCKGSSNKRAPKEGSKLMLTARQGGMHVESQGRRSRAPMSAAPCPSTSLQ
jgi:hypothetical protein